MRTPETHYFDHGYVKFHKAKQSMIYQIYRYSNDGSTVWLYSSGKVKDEAHLKQLLALQDLGKV